MLRTIRKQKQMTQAHLASAVGVSREAICYYESGVSKPSLRVAIAIARTLDSTVEDLFGHCVPDPAVNSQVN